MKKIKKLNNNKSYVIHRIEKRIIAGDSQYGWETEVFSARLIRNCRWFVRLIVALVVAQVSVPLFAIPVAIDFETLADSETVTNQFAGLTFSNSKALSAGISLNEFEFPPRSGANVVLDDGGAISITFASLAQSFGAYFTYSSSISLKAFDGAANLH
jgi:hypothetical protein